LLIRTCCLVSWGTHRSNACLRHLGSLCSIPDSQRLLRSWRRAVHSVLASHDLCSTAECSWRTLIGSAQESSRWDHGLSGIASGIPLHPLQPLRFQLKSIFPPRTPRELRHIFFWIPLSACSQPQSLSRHAELAERTAFPCKSQCALSCSDGLRCPSAAASKGCSVLC